MGDKKLKSDGVDSDSEPEAVSPEPPPVASPPVSSPLRAPPQSEPMALLETAELVETPRPTGVAPELSPSPPGGEAPMPSMPVTVRESDLSQSLEVEVPQESEVNWHDLDQRVEELLNRFFENNSNWLAIQEAIRTEAQESLVSKEVQYFRIQVPSPYPGVQYRRSMDLEDRYRRYAKQGQTVEGVVEANGEWLQISEKVFLPMKVAAVGIMQPITREERQQAVQEEQARKAGEMEQSPQVSDLPSMEAGSPLPDMEVENSFRQNTLRVTPGLPEAICKAPLQDPGALSEFYSQNPINAFDSRPDRNLVPKAGADAGRGRLQACEKWQDIVRRGPRGLQRLRSFSKGLAYAHSQAYRHVCGPEWIRTLRGELLGRSVALVLCGEAHEDVLDLTRKKCIIEPEKGWRPVEGDFTDAVAQLGTPMATKDCGTLKSAKSWAAETVDDAEDSEEDDLIGAKLIFQAGDRPGAKGTARVYRPSQPWHRHSPHLRPHRSPRLGPHSPPPVATSTPKLQVFEWSDLDKEAEDFNKRRLKGEEIPVEEHDALIAKRKEERRAEGIELFDDWLLRHLSSLKAGRRLEIVLEAHVPASEVELHEEPGSEPCRPHECLQSLEPDSEGDSEDERDPDDGTGTFLDFLRRRLLQHWPKGVTGDRRVRHIDPRDLGDDDHADLRQAFQDLLQQPLPVDPEQKELEQMGVEEFDAGHMGVVASRKARRAEQRPTPLPSWEAFFGAAAELLYYSPHVKADYVPFLTGCIGAGLALKAFFKDLVFGTVPEAMSRLRLEGELRSMACLRSLVYREAGGKLWRRPNDGGLVPVRRAPLERYLKAKGSQPPRTWISGLAEQLRSKGAVDFVQRAEDWYFRSVDELLADPKAADADGDYFIAWLRECHREVYADVDRSDPKELRSLKKVRSTSNRSKRYDLASIQIPNVQEAFEELATFDPKSGPSSRRQRVLAKMIIDSFQLRSVDLAAVLTMADCILEAPEGEEVVVVLYAGGVYWRWASQAGLGGQR
ncbi:unnamed protein product [Durusdinium trenchii]|uniref:Uncharacterized protein n=1 Tax=Durusdinium trenchii TaxID=1381693 RepID=A0ABP0P1Q0_9DINO